ncbi:MAG: HAD family hydrolase [Candidatus Symbiothrix sp.]|jgi:histidinol-phosphate phosphatase family protein|nr:HAD family hydrolase [Candidatus Symbiothrix sp.]
MKTLFLDRDGVINRERPGDYVKTRAEFIFLPGVLEALAILNKHFDRIFIVSNQRGVGKGIMTRETLDDIHAWMLQEINAAGGRIDKIYVCTDINDHSFHRKPNTGMALQAANDFPEVILTESIMVGNSLSDMEFGKNADMQTVLVGDKYAEKNVPLADYFFKDLLAFAQHL